MAKDGKLKVLHTTMEGIENAPMALAMLFDGKNTGKMQCRLCSDEDVARELGRAKL
jgi:NADPH-dependent curcumin reductase CurA